MTISCRVGTQPRCYLITLSNTWVAGCRSTRIISARASLGPRGRLFELFDCRKTTERPVRWSEMSVSCGTRRTCGDGMRKRELRRRRCVSSPSTRQSSWYLWVGHRRSKPRSVLRPRRATTRITVRYGRTRGAGKLGPRGAFFVDPASAGTSPSRLALSAEVPGDFPQSGRVERGRAAGCPRALSVCLLRSVSRRCPT